MKIILVFSNIFLTVSIVHLLKNIKGKYYVKNGTDGVTDTIRNLFDNHTKDNFRYVELLLAPFRSLLLIFNYNKVYTLCILCWYGYFMLSMI